MPRLRSSPAHQIEDAIEDLITIGLSARGINFQRTSDASVTIDVGRQTWPAKVIARDAVSRRDVEELLATEARGSKIVVANHISTDAKDLIERRNADQPNFWWSWLDRRGDLQLNHPHGSGVVDFDASALGGRAALPGGWRLASPRSDGPIRGRAGLGYAAMILLDPERRPSIREVAAAAGMSHGAVGEASKVLRQAGLVLASGDPQTPELFWALADAWGPTCVTPVHVLPTHSQAVRLRANADDLAEPGWALGGDAAASAWGAPVFAAETKPWIWVPTEADARRVERSLDPATWHDYSAVVAVTPTLVASRHRMQPPSATDPTFLPTLHPLFLALELAQDPARGREILDQWTPDAPEVHRAW